MRLSFDPSCHEVVDVVDEMLGPYSPKNHANVEVVVVGAGGGGLFGKGGGGGLGLGSLVSPEKAPALSELAELTSVAIEEKRFACASAASRPGPSQLLDELGWELTG